MAPITEYIAEQLQFAADNMKGLLRPENEEDAKLVQKGLMLFRQGLVYQLRFDGDKMAAAVQDVVPVQVVVDLSFLEVSECSCPQEGFCRHQLAVFFQGLSQAGSVATWVEEWRQPIQAKKIATNLGLQTARDLLKTSKKFGAGGNYDDWTKTFSQIFRMIMRGQGAPQPFVVGDLFRVYWKRIKADAPYEAEWKTLYEVVAAVHSFKLLTALSQELEHTDYQIDRYYRILFQTIIEGAEMAMKKLSVHSLPFAFDQFIEQLKDDSADLLTVYRPLEFEGISFYRSLWSQLLNKAPWREAERQRLEQKLETDEIERAGLEADAINTERVWLEKQSASNEAEQLRLAKLKTLWEVERAQAAESGAIHRNHLPVAVGLIHQQILAKNDDQALELMTRLGDPLTPHMFYWLELLTEQKEWKRLGPYIDHFISRLHNYLGLLSDFNAGTEFTMLAMEVLAPYCTETGRLDLFERTLTQTLPYSYREYEAYLFQQMAFDKWVELQAYVGVELSYMSKNDLKEVQKADPASLLPIYHQTVQDLINMKNRGSYREAVKLMKKIRTIYKKIHRTPDWDRFFEQILNSTKRLRAFHEELQRGKLLNA